MPPETTASVDRAATPAARQDADAAPPRAPAWLELRVNGEPRRVAAGCCVDGLLRELALDGRRIAVAIERCVVPRSAWPTRRLEAGDRVEILEAVGGG